MRKNILFAFLFLMGAIPSIAQKNYQVQSPNRDMASLSYVYPLDAKHWLLMLDSCIMMTEIMWKGVSARQHSNGWKSISGWQRNMIFR